METIGNGLVAMFAVVFVLGVTAVMVLGMAGLVIGAVLIHKAQKHKRILLGAAAVGVGAVAYRYAPQMTASMAGKFQDIQDAVQHTVRVDPETGEVFDDLRDRVRFQ